ncbi:MAG: hypothetical protein AB8G05_01470 [Oligoflexales bacterium]
MSIENMTKLEVNEDGTYTVSCNNKCQTEVVTKNDVVLGDICQPEYHDEGGSFIPVGGEFKFTSYQDTEENNYGERIQCEIGRMRIDRLYTLNRRSNHHLLLVNGWQYQCLSNYKDRSYVFITQYPRTIVSIDIDDNNKLKLIQIQEENKHWQNGIEGHYKDNDILRLELERRELRKKSG